MKTFQKSLKAAALGVAIVTLASLGTTPGHAEAQKNEKIGILDVNRIIAEANAAKEINVQMEKYQKEFQADIKKQEESLRTLNNQLVQDEKKLGAQAIEKKKADFEAKVANLQKTVMTRNRELQEAAQTSMEKVRGSVVSISEKIRTQRGFSLILPSSFPVTFDQSLDITNEVILALNKELPTIKVEIPQAKPATVAKTAKAAAAA